MMLEYNNTFFSQIKNYEDYYINNTGVVLSTKWNKFKILKQHKNKKGYYYVTVPSNGKFKKLFIHKLVAEYFVVKNNIDINDVVNHLDGNKENNFYENLEWTTFSGNTKHAIEKGFLIPKKGEDVGTSKLTEKEVLEIRELYSSGKYTQKELGNMFNISRSNIKNIINRNSWKHI